MASHARPRVSPTVPKGAHARPNHRATPLSRAYANPQPVVGSKSIGHAPGAAQPVPSRGGPKAAGGPAPMAAGMVAKKMGQVGTGIAKDSVNNGGVTIMVGTTFLIVALAKWRGKANIDTRHALAGGLVFLFGITILYKINARIGMAFAALVMIMALMEYGQPALGGLLSGAGVPKGNTTAGLVQGFDLSTSPIPGAYPGDLTTRNSTTAGGKPVNKAQDPTLTDVGGFFHK